MPFRDLPDLLPVELEAFRNIATCLPSQSLFDDLTDDPESTSVFQAWDNETSGINHQQPQRERVFQYGDVESSLACFDVENWGLGRFGDGESYGVWYGASDERTSIIETLRFQVIFNRPVIQATGKTIRIDRRMFRARLQSDRAMDFMSTLDKHPLLTHETEYGYCHELGRYAVENKVDIFITPSVRNPGGKCYPVFNPEAIIEDKGIFFLHFTLSPSADPIITVDKDEVFPVPLNW
jgi:hypothetical protein